MKPKLTTIQIISKAQQEKFLHFPWKIYANDANWVPPLLMEQRRLLNREKNPGFKHCLYNSWIIYKEKEIAGRILAFIDDSYNELYKEATGFLGFFESINDQDVANELFNVGINWLKNKGITKVYGPMNFSIANECGIQLTGFETPPMLQMNYTPPYFKSLFEIAGFTKAHDLYAYIMTENIVNEQPDLLPRLQKICEKISKRSDITLRSLNMKTYKSEMNHINSLYNSFMNNNWGFVPSSIEEMLFTAESMKLIVDPELVFFAEVKGKVVGCSLSIPDFNQVQIRLNGKLFPFGIFKMFYYKRKINQLRVMLLGINEEFRTKGLDILFYYYTIKKGLERGYKQAELSWISEDNKVLLSIMEKIGAQRYKVYRMYEKVLA